MENKIGNKRLWKSIPKDIEEVEREIKARA